MNQADLDRIVAFRMTELEAQEEILISLREVNRGRLYLAAGHRSFQEFCREELGYEQSEIREIMLRLNLIVTADQLRSPDKDTQNCIDKLKVWRKSTASKRGIAAYRVLSNRTLLKVAELKPRNEGELTKVTGIGPAKLADFGAEILSIVQ
jgi:superfamily II DNA helicase RecQ